MEPGMIGFRCNYATIGPGGLITDRRAGRIHDTLALSKAIEEGVDLSPFGVTFSFRSGAGHRAALAIRGEGLGADVTSNDPKKEGSAPYAFQAKGDAERDKKTALVLTGFVRQAEAILENHPVNIGRRERGLPSANTILIRGAGEMGHFEPFSSRYGLSGAVISAAALISGIGRVVGLTPVAVPGITGSVNTNLSGKVDAVLRSLDEYDFILLNIKGADEEGHDGHAEGKRDFISRIDAALAPFAGREDTVFAFCGDHSTPCAVKDHSADPVPVLIWGEGVRTDAVDRFDEISCAGGGLCRIRGDSLLPILCDLVNKAQKFGA